MVRKRRRRSPGSPGAAEGPEAVRPASVRGTVRLRVRVHPRELLEELRGCADSRTPRRGRSRAANPLDDAPAAAFMDSSGRDGYWPPDVRAASGRSPGRRVLRALRGLSLIHISEP